MATSRCSRGTRAIALALWLGSAVGIAVADDEKRDGPLPSQTPAPSATASVPVQEAVTPAVTEASKVSPVTESTEKAEIDTLAEARFSMQLQNAPLLQMLKFLGVSSPVRFRYATPPDATVTATLQDAPLLSTLENLMHSVGFVTQRDGLNIFVCRHGAAMGAANAKTVLPESWQMWTRRVPPPPRWMAPSPLPDRPRVGTKDQWKMEKDAATAAMGVAWRPALLNFEGRKRPGIAVRVNPSFVQEADVSDIVYLRWNLTLRQVPRGAQLLLESPYEVTLYVNGAPLLRRFRSIRLVDLDDVLQPGDNCLAIALHRDKQGGLLKAGAESEKVSAGKVEAPVIASIPTTPSAGEQDLGIKLPALLLRYEWFFGGDES